MFNLAQHLHNPKCWVFPREQTTKWEMRNQGNASEHKTGCQQTEKRDITFSGLSVCLIIVALFAEKALSFYGL